MPTKVAFDNNFLDAFVGADVATREAIFLCVQLGHLEMYASYEMLREVMGLAVTTRKDKIIPFARDILRLTQGKVLRLADAQESELRGSFELLMEEGARKQIVEFLQQAAGGHIPVAAATIGQGAIDEKSESQGRDRRVVRHDREARGQAEQAETQGRYVRGHPKATLGEHRPRYRGENL
jgi:hypothetical protein